jgi:type II secretory pathway component PulM
MIPSGNEERRSDLKSNLLERLHDPLQLRICVLVVVLATGYFGVYVPLSGKIIDTTKKLERDRKMLELAGSIEQLQKQFHHFEDRVPQQADSKEWVQYVLEGIRQLPVNLISLDCKTPKEIGPYRAIMLQVQLEGTFFELDQVLRWLEANRRLLRADEVTLSPGRGVRGTITMHLTLLGMTG